MISQVEYLFSHRQSSIATEEGQQIFSMSLPQKMYMWSKTLEAGTQDGENKNLHQESPDNSDSNAIPEHNGSGKIARFADSKRPLLHEHLLNSKAYSSLVQHLDRECSLRRWRKTSVTMNEIHQYVYKKIVTSPERSKIDHYVTFCLQFRPIEEFLSGYAVQRPETMSQIQLRDIVTVTSSATGAQVSTVAQYFEQVWGSRGEPLLRAIQLALDRSSHRERTMLQSIHRVDGLEYAQDNTKKVTACVYGSSLYVGFYGKADFITEGSEQLGWLAASFRLAPKNTILSCRSFIKSLKMQRLIRQRIMLSSDYTIPFDPCDQPSSSSLGFEIIVRGSESRSSKYYEDHWLRKFGYPFSASLALGFPTARQPGSLSGLELTFEALLRLVGDGFLSDSDGIGLFGYWGKLELLGRSNGIYYWHVFHSSDEPFCHTKRVSTNLKDRYSISSDFQNGRHIVCNCVSTAAGVDESKRFSPLPGCYGLKPLTDDHITSLICEPHTDMNSSGSSYSKSPDLETAGSEDGKSLGFIFFGRVFRTLALSFLNEVHTTAAIDDYSSNSPAPQKRQQASAGPYSPILLLPSGNRKRQHNGGSDSGDEEGAGRPPMKKSKPEPTRILGRPRFIACPFWKLDPRKHWDCFSKRITNISYAKQHLNRRHTPEIYCQRCFYIFDEEELLESHVVDSNCVRDPVIQLEGVSQAQKRQLKRGTKGTVEEQWYAMWEILFPTQSRPSSIYVDSDQTKDFALLREFGQRQGLTVLYDEVRASGRILRSDVSDQLVREVLGRALDAMFEYYRISQDVLSGTSNMPSRQESTSIPLSDSGISQGVQPSSHDSQSGAIREPLGQENRHFIAETNLEDRPSAAMTFCTLPGSTEAIPVEFDNDSWPNSERIVDWDMLMNDILVANET